MKLHALALLFFFAIALAAPMQSLQSIQDAVRTFVKSALDAEGKYELEQQPLDSHLQLPQCDEDLQAFSQTGELKAGRMTIGVRCKGSKKWQIYSLVSIKSYKNVLVLSKPLRRGEMIHAEDLVSENREVGGLSHGYIIDPSEVNQ